MKNFLKSKTNFRIVFLLILFLGAYFRFHNINWDQNQHLHPDERFLTMVATAIDWPKNFSEYLNTNSSPLNPHNRNFDFYVYGTFPLFFVKLITQILNKGDYNSLTLVGRFLSGFFDVGTMLIVFFITKKLTKNIQISLLGMFIYAVSVLPIQLSHFFTVDPYLTFFITLSFYLLILITLPKRNRFLKQTLLASFLGITFGLAFASKIQALTFLPIILLGIISLIKKRRNTNFVKILCIFAVSTLLVIRIFQPYLFADQRLIPLQLNSKTIANWKDLNRQYSKETYKNQQIFFPPATMFIATKDYVFPFNNLVLWGLGLPLGITSIGAVFYLCLKHIRRGKKPSKWPILMLLFWVIYSFVYQGQAFAKYLRYFYIIFPFLSVISSIFIIEIAKKRRGVIYVFLTLSFLWALAFDSIYSHPHPRIRASKWIYQNIEKGATLGHEVWDDTLPLCLPNFPCNSYSIIDFPLYDLETKEKWTAINKKISKTDYIILSSNRLYGSIMAVSDRYPTTNEFYKSLFDGSLGFEKVAEFTSRPNLYVPFINICITPPGIWYGAIAAENQECNLSGISFVDDYADESFTVYDHPKVLIFKKNSSIQY